MKKIILTLDGVLLEGFNELCSKYELVIESSINTEYDRYEATIYVATDHQNLIKDFLEIKLAELKAEAIAHYKANN